MPCLLDTSILTRLINTTDAQHAQAKEAVLKLFTQGEDLCITAQNIIEFWTVATRPIAVNGLGLSPQDAAKHIQQIQNTFILLEDEPAIFQTWQTLVIAAGVEGKQAHDARLAAVALLIYVEQGNMAFSGEH